MKLNIVITKIQSHNFLSLVTQVFTPIYSNIPIIYMCARLWFVCVLLQHYYKTVEGTVDQSRRGLRPATIREKIPMFPTRTLPASTFTLVLPSFPSISFVIDVPPLFLPFPLPTKSCRPTAVFFSFFKIPNSTQIHHYGFYFLLRWISCWWIGD